MKSIDFTHMSPDEVRSWIEKFGSEEQIVLLDKLWHELEDDLDWSGCPNCENFEIAIEKAIGNLEDV